MGRGVATAALNMDMLAPAARREAYDTFVDVFQTSFLSDDVQANLRSCRLDDLHIVAGTASPRRTERLVGRIARDRYDAIAVQPAVTGRATGTSRHCRFVSDPGTVMVLDLAQPFCVTDEEPRDVINVTIPRARFLPHVEDVRGLHGLTLSTAHGCGAMLGRTLRDLAQEMAVLPASAAPILTDTIVGMLLLGLGYEVTGDPSRGPSGARK